MVAKAQVKVLRSWQGLEAGVHLQYLIQIFLIIRIAISGKVKRN